MDLALAAFLTVYFTPSIVAAHRDHPHERGVFLATLLLAWTGIGWLGALWWAVRTPRRAGARTPQLRLLVGGSSPRSARRRSASAAGSPGRPKR